MNFLTVSLSPLFCFLFDAHLLSISVCSTVHPGVFAVYTTKKSLICVIVNHHPLCIVFLRAKHVQQGANKEVGVLRSALALALLQSSPQR